MLSPEKLDEIVRQFTDLLPRDLQQTREDIGRNLKAAFTASLARMDLVTREEFDVQSELLAKSRVLLDELQEKIAELETRLNQEE